MRATEHQYQVDGEVGRFTFTTHEVERDGRVIYSTAGSVFPERAGREWYKTYGFKEIAMIYGSTEVSYRKASKLINRIRYQEGATPVRTLRHNTEAEGAEVIDFRERKVAWILERNDFTEEGIPGAAGKRYVRQPVLLSEEEIRKATEECSLSWEEEAEIRKNPVPYECPEETVNLSVDGVVTKKQKEERSGKGKTEDKAKRSRKQVNNTVAHIEKAKKDYVINGHNTVSVLRLIIGFLLNNDLLKYRLQFFVDGQKSLQDGIFRAFSWFSDIGLILDWYHLQDKCKRELSMAMKGRHIRNTVLSELMPILWYGMTDKATKYLEELQEGLIKDKKALSRLINYIDRNREFIPCYGIRKKLGLRNSSNTGEKMNDLVVSHRQKHDGMSWSESGSVSLASIEVLKRNREWAKWFEEGDLEFKLAA